MRVLVAVWTVLLLDFAWAYVFGWRRINRPGSPDGLATRLYDWIGRPAEAIRKSRSGSRTEKT